MPLSEEEQAASAAKPDRMAIGVEGGFNVDAKKYKIETDWVRNGVRAAGSGRAHAFRMVLLGCKWCEHSMPVFVGSAGQQHVASSCPTRTHRSMHCCSHQ